MGSAGDETSKKWLYDANIKSSAKEREFACGRIKVYLYESLYRSLTKHDLRECFKLIEVLPKETSLDPYVLFRLIMILIACNPTEAINKNVIIHLESLISSLDVCRPDIFIEFLSYFIRHNRIDDAKELLSHRHRFMSRKTHRVVPHVDTNFQCYQFLLNYLKWSESISKRGSKPKFDVSIQGWIVNVAEHLTSTEKNHEYFLMCLLRVLLFYGFNKKAYLFSSQFQRINPDNLSGQLLHHHLLYRLSLVSVKSETDLLLPDEEIPMNYEISEEDREINRCEDMLKLSNFHINEEAINLERYPIEQDKRSVAANLRRLDPCIEELVKLDGDNKNPINTLKDILDTLEFIEEISNMTRWRKLLKLVEFILHSKDAVLMREARLLWGTRYRLYWKPINFIDLAGPDITKRAKNELLKIIDTLNTSLDFSATDVDNSEDGEATSDSKKRRISTG